MASRLTSARICGTFLDTLRRRPDFDFNPGLWVDQICIDQSCTEERNQQVQLMQHIYSNVQVLVWLGPASRDSGIAVSAIIDPPPGLSLRESCDVSPTPLLGNRKELSLRHAPVHGPFLKVEEANVCKLIYIPLGDIMRVAEGIRPAHLRDSTARPENIPAEQAVRDLLSRPYWSRLWIIQELALAGSIAFLCGNDCFTLSQLSDFLNLTDSWSYQKAILNISYRRHILHQADERVATAMSTLTNVLYSLCEAECQDPRDKVFGLQALVIPQDRVEIDYAASRLDVFLAVVHKALQTDGEDHTGLLPESMQEDYVKNFLHQVARSLGLTFNQAVIDKMVDLILLWKACKNRPTIAWLSHNLREALAI